MQALNLSIRFSPDLMAEEIQLGETLMMNVRTLAYFGLDPLGTRFWRAMQDSRDADEVLAQVAAATGRPAAELAPRLSAILQGMAAAGLIALESRQ